MNGSKPPVDPKVAALLSAVFAILGALEVFSRLDLTADQVAILIGALGTLGSMGRAWWLDREHKKFTGAVDSLPGGRATPAEMPDDSTPPKGLALVQALAAFVAMALAGIMLSISPLAFGAVAVSIFLLFGTLYARRWARYFALPALALALTGCAGMSGPGLQSVVGRIDVTRAIQCAREPDAASKARCLGVEVLSQGIEIALGEAANWGEKALKAASGTGADDMSDAEIQEIAANADAALNKLGAELAAAGAE